MSRGKRFQEGIHEAGADLFTREGEHFARWKDAKGKMPQGPGDGSKYERARILIEAKTNNAKPRCSLPAGQSP